MFSKFFSKSAKNQDQNNAHQDSKSLLQELSVESIAEIAAHLSYVDLCNLQLVSKTLKKLLDDEKVIKTTEILNKQVWYRFVTSEFGAISEKPKSWKTFFLNESVKFIGDKIEFIEATEYVRVSLDKKTLSGVDGHVQSFSLPSIKLHAPFRYYFEIIVTTYYTSNLVAIGVSPDTKPTSSVIGCDNNFSFFYGDCYGLYNGTLHRGKTTKFGPSIKTNDTVGVYLDMKKKMMSVWVNGKMVGVAFQNMDVDTVYPAFSIQGEMKITVSPKPSVTMAQLMYPTSSS